MVAADITTDEFIPAAQPDPASPMKDLIEFAPGPESPRLGAKAFDEITKEAEKELKAMHASASCNTIGSAACEKPNLGARDMAFLEELEQALESKGLGPTLNWKRFIDTLCFACLLHCLALLVWLHYLPLLACLLLVDCSNRQSNKQQAKPRNRPLSNKTSKQSDMDNTSLANTQQATPILKGSIYKQSHKKTSKSNKPSKQAN